MEVYWGKVDDLPWWPVVYIPPSLQKNKNESNKSDDSMEKGITVTLLALDKEVTFPNKNYFIEFSQYKYDVTTVEESLRSLFIKAIEAANEIRKNPTVYPPCTLLKRKDSKREDYISWDEYFMGLACLSAMRSKDPNTQVGACIVNEFNQIIGIGYNGFPRGCSDDVLPWAREAENELDTKYMYVCHAEMNAILNMNSANARGCKLYVTLFPCNNCCKMIIQSGIAEVIYLGDKYHDSNMSIASRRMFDMAGVKYTLYTGKREDIMIKMSV